ncbi:hypothetical protein LOK46_29690 [Methylobacterium sp. NMS14P]|uniref:hypothetical protein n=1 Tax=Methylobacterium sp. NMS14P TaxID=2894310 RepID=UPI002358EA7E|nr:hypothetical protein [Methylobacterium sp. NMS14P]WCS25240.1 hypothetical protein LOK46_29690 [Methylobacterium sp. NMS14P]
MIVPPTQQDAANDYRLSAGLLKAHVLDGVPIERLAADYGYTATRLRTKLLDHVAACFVAIQGPIEEPEATPVAPAPPAVRVRERIAPPAPAERPRIRAVRRA